MTDEPKKAIPGPMVELDLAGDRPLVRVDGIALEGVSQAVLEVNAFETPVLVLRMVRFEVKGGVLPHGMTLYSRKENG